MVAGGGTGRRRSIFAGTAVGNMMVDFRLFADRIFSKTSGGGVFAFDTEIENNIKLFLTSFPPHVCSSYKMLYILLLVSIMEKFQEMRNL